MAEEVTSTMDWEHLPRSSFGDGPEPADELLTLVLAGRKRATCWSAADGAKDTVSGGRWVVQDGKGRPRAVLQTVALFTERFIHINDDFAAAEGEGDLSLSYWREAHRTFFTNNGGFDPEMLLWCERFELIAVLPTSD